MMRELNWTTAGVARQLLLSPKTENQTTSKRIMKTTLDSETALNAKAQRCKDARMGARNLFRFSAGGHSGRQDRTGIVRIMKLLIAAFTLPIISARLPIGAQTFDAIRDFSTAVNNDTSRWSYRYKVGTVRDGNYPLLPVYGDAVCSWSPTNPGAWTVGGNNPGVGVNQTGGDATIAPPSAAFTWPRDTMSVHPGSSDLVVVSWLSWSATWLSIDFSFADLDTNGGNGIAWFVEKNNSANTLSSGTYPHGGTSGLLTLNGISVSAGDRINFIVDPNGEYSYDSTQIIATITPWLPRLQINASNDSVTLSWPTQAVGFVLEWCDRLGSSEWVVFNGPILIVGSQNNATFSRTGDRYFRLRNE